MDDETRTVFARFERYFELIQAQLVTVTGRVEAVDGRLEAIEGGLEAIEGRLEALEERVGNLEATAVAHDNSIAGLRAELRAHRTETAERFLSAEEPIRTLSTQVRQLEIRTDHHLENLAPAVSHLAERMTGVEKAMIGVHVRLDGLSDEMRQRFRVVNDRLTGMEKGEAA